MGMHESACRTCAPASCGAVSCCSTLSTTCLISRSSTCSQAVHVGSPLMELNPSRAEGQADKHLEPVGLAQVRDLVHGLIKVVQREVLCLPQLVHLQQPPQVAHLPPRPAVCAYAVQPAHIIVPPWEAWLTSCPLPFMCRAKRSGKLQKTSAKASLSCKAKISPATRRDACAQWLAG